jgi:hypothetical protein
LPEINDPAFVLRIGSEEAEKAVFVKRMLYVGLNRDWKAGSPVLFSRKSDSILGSGIISTIKQLDELETSDRVLCLQRNWSSKLLFASLARFLPPVPISATPLATQSPMSLHGSKVSGEIAARIDDLASVKIIT